MVPGEHVAACMRDMWRPPNGVYGGHMVTCYHACGGNEWLSMCVCVVHAWDMCVGVPCMCVCGACAWLVCMHVRASGTCGV